MGAHPCLDLTPSPLSISLCWRGGEKTKKVPSLMERGFRGEVQKAA
jgi:hypothetical protein